MLRNLERNETFEFGAFSHYISQMALTPRQQPQAVVDRNSCRKEGEPRSESSGSECVRICVNCSIREERKRRRLSQSQTCFSCFSLHVSRRRDVLVKSLSVQAARRGEGSFPWLWNRTRYGGGSVFLCQWRYVVCICLRWVWQRGTLGKAGAPDMWGLKCLERLLFAEAGLEYLKICPCTETFVNLLIWSRFSL